MADRLDMPDALAEIRADVAALLDGLRVVTGDARFAHAAGILRGGRGGRPPTDDAEALALAEMLVAEGQARSTRAACQLVAVLYSQSPSEIERMINRLRKKLSINN